MRDCVMPTSTPAPTWLDEVPVQPGPPWLSMGTRPLDLDRWLVVDEAFSVEMGLKARLLDERHDEVVVALPGSDAASAECLEMIEAWLDERGHRVGSPPDGLHPIDRAGRLVQEDLCIVEQRDGRWVMTAASVCFPSHWRIGDKLGRSVAAIHAPVHHYDTELRQRVDNFFDRMRVDRPVWRRNVSIHSHDELFRPEPHEDLASFDGLGPDEVWLRSEYETLRRLPDSDAIVFTIKTQQCPVARLRARPDVARALGAKLAALRPELERLGEPVPFPARLPGWLGAC